MLNVQQFGYRINQKTLLSDIDFSLEPGTVMGILGPNGAGKTTLLRGISGQLLTGGKDSTDIREGVIFWQDSNVYTLSLQVKARAISVVNQINDPVLGLSLEQVVDMGNLVTERLLHKKSAANRKRVVKALTYMGLEKKRNQMFNKLSGGEQQRTLIARALVQNTPLMILDEPVNHLDIKYQHKILSLFRELAQKHNKTIVLSLHDVNLANDYCDKVMLLKEGKALGFGSTTAVLNTRLLSHAFDMPCHHIPSDLFSAPRVFFCE